MTLAKAYPGILQEYLEIAKSLSGKDKKILKTDLFNEVKNLPIKGGILGNILAKEKFAIEIREDYVKKASRMDVVVRRGDIRSLTYANKSMDVILDFSTIDHVVEFEQVISEYARVLKSGGKLGLVYWSMPFFTVRRKQVYFVRSEIMAELDRYFECERDWDLFVDEKLKRVLVGFIGVRRDT